jgi:hypothetical protein
MSPDADALLARVYQLYVRAGSPDLGVWYCDLGLRDAAHDELALLGLLGRVFGTERGFGWRLTEDGLTKASQAPLAP